MTIAPTRIAPDGNDLDRLPTRFWTRAEYYAAAEAGIFRLFERLELLEGEIVSMSPKGVRHVNATGNTIEKLRRGYADVDCVIRKEDPVVLDDATEPEPDVVVARGKRADYADHHPRADEVLLIIEVADSTLLADRVQKGRIYARAGIPEYWLLNLLERRIEIFREPRLVNGVPAYGIAFTLRADDFVAALFASDCLFQVGDLLA